MLPRLRRVHGLHERAFLRPARRPGCWATSPRSRARSSASPTPIASTAKRSPAFKEARFRSPWTNGTTGTARHLYGEIGTQYFLKDALGIAAGLHEYFRNSDIIFMANYAQTVNVIGAIKTTKTAAVFDTTGLVLKLYRNHYGTIPVKVGGAPEPLDVAAAWKDGRKVLTVAVVNPTKSGRDVPADDQRREPGRPGQAVSHYGEGRDFLQRPGKRAGRDARGEGRRAVRPDADRAADERQPLRGRRPK